MLSIFAFAAFGQNANAPQNLSLNQPLTRQIKGGETQTFQFAVEAGFYARAEVEQKNVDLVVSLFAPDGKLIVEMNGKDGHLWREAVSAIAETAGIYQVHITAYGSSAWTGNYRIDFSENRKSVSDDRQRLLAEEGLSKARMFDINNESEKSLRCYIEAATIFEQLGDKNLTAAASVNSGRLSINSANYFAAKNFYEKALILLKTAGDRLGESKAMNGLGNVYFRLKKFETSKEYYEQALEIKRELKDFRDESNVLSNLGAVHLELKEYNLAILLMEESLSVKSKLGNNEGEAEIFNNLGFVYFRLLEANPHNSNLSFFRGKGTTITTGFICPPSCSTISLSYPSYNSSTDAEKNLIEQRRRYFEKSKFYYESALDVAKGANDATSEAIILNNLGLLHQYYFIDNHPASRDTRKYFFNAESYQKPSFFVDNHPASRDTRKYFFNAESYYNQALEITKKIKNRNSEADVLHNLMLLHRLDGNDLLAITYGKQSVNILQSIRKDIRELEIELRNSFVKANEETFRILADLLIFEGRLPEAQTVLNLIKDEEYQQFARSGEIADTIPYSKSEAVVVAKVDRLAILESEQTELRKQKKDEDDKFPSDKQTRLEQIAADIKVANVEFDYAIAALSKSDASVKDQIADIQSEKNLQSALQNLGKELNTGAVALYTVIGTEEGSGTDGEMLKGKTHSKFGWVILVTSKNRKAYPIDVTDLEQNVFQLRTALSSDQHDPKPLAEKIYNAIFRQTSAKQKVTLEQDLNHILGKYQDKTIMWSLDGVLRYIPMAALHDGKGYLVEKYRNVVFTKESLLWLMNSPKANPETLGLGVSAGNKDLNMTALPGVDKELSDIIRQTNEKTGILNGTRKLNGNFKKQEILNLKDEDNNFQVVHIASHYSFNPTDQNASYLLIGDGKLTFGDMKTENNLFGTVDLLTLSACDTGVSGNGKEAEGFAYLAQSLGAKSVIASLWEVSDAGTPELMIRFYKLRAENPQMSKGEAFRQAQLAMLGAETKTLPPTGKKRSVTVDLSGLKIDLPEYVKDAKHPFAHPHYWSSFVLIGNWR